MLPNLTEPKGVTTQLTEPKGVTTQLTEPKWVTTHLKYLDFECILIVLFVLLKRVRVLETKLVSLLAYVGVN